MLPLENDASEIAYTKQFWIGIGVSILTNLIQSFAMAFQRKSHLQNEQHLIEERKHSFQRPLWVISFATFLTANTIGSIFSIGYLPIVILAPISAMGLVFNAIAARLVLGDPFKRQTLLGKLKSALADVLITYYLLGTLLIVMGALLVGLFGIIPEPDHDIDDLLRLYRKPSFIAYFSVLEFVIITGLIVTHYFERLYYLMESAAIPPTSLGKLLGQHISMGQLRQYVGISYGVLSGNISSQSILFAKSGLELVLLSVMSDKNQLQYALTYVLLGMMLLTAILQLYYLNKGLQLCDTVIMIPLSSCTFNVSCLFNGLVYYDQWNRIAWWHLLLVMVGVAITITGVLLISWRPSAELIEEPIEVLAQDNERTRLLSKQAI